MFRLVSIENQAIFMQKKSNFVHNDGWFGSDQVEERIGIYEREDYCKLNLPNVFNDFKLVY